MKRTSVQLVMMFALLLVLSWAASSAFARPVDGGSTSTSTTLDIPVPNPGGEGDDNPILPDLQGDPDDLLGGNLSVTEPVSPKKPEAPASSSLWMGFLRWLWSSLEHLSLTR